MLNNDEDVNEGNKLYAGVKGNRQAHTEGRNPEKNNGTPTESAPGARRAKSTHVESASVRLE
jgi:hypothetical protein